MIKKTDAMISFAANTERTEMLITAMAKIKAYNWLYQQKTFEKNLKMGYVVEKVQNKELEKIEKSCAEHAIISLCTNFEVYYKDFVQELLYKFPGVFKNKNTKYKEKIIMMLSDQKDFDYESIGYKLSLKNRFDYIEFFEIYSIPFLTDDEKEIIEHVYIIRNNYVHNAGRKDKQTKNKLEKYPSPTGESYLTTEAKRLRTKFKRLIIKANERTMSKCERMNSLIVR